MYLNNKLLCCNSFFYIVHTKTYYMPFINSTLDILLGLKNVKSEIWLLNLPVFSFFIVKDSRTKIALCETFESKANYKWQWQHVPEHNVTPTNIDKIQDVIALPSLK